MRSLIPGRALAALSLLALCAAGAAAQGDTGESHLIALSSRTFVFERIGEFTSLRCEADEQSLDCQLFEQMDVSPQIDWEALLAKARRNAPKTKARDSYAAPPVVSEYVVDRYGGPWRVTLSGGGGLDAPEFLRPFACRIRPGFPGYKVALRADKIGGVEVLRDDEQWRAACKELGLDETGKKRKGSWKKLFE